VNISFARLDGTWHGYDKANESYKEFGVYRITTLCGESVGGNSQSMKAGHGDRLIRHPTPICRICLLKIVEFDSAGTAHTA
jgi:hypothetical protein